MTDADLRQLRRELSALRPGGTARRFLYCPAGPDGFPVLQVSRRISPTAVTTLLRWAKNRSLVQGAISRGASGGVRFVSPRADAVFLDAIADFFAQDIPALSREKLSARAATPARG